MSSPVMCQVQCCEKCAVCSHLVLTTVIALFSEEKKSSERLSDLTKVTQIVKQEEHGYRSYDSRIRSSP